MSKSRTIAVLVGQAYEYYQASFLEGFIEDMFAEDYDVCVFAMYEKYQNTAAREIGETSIFKLIPYDRFDGYVLMLDTMQTPGLVDSVMDEIRKYVTVPVITVDKKIEGYPCIMPRHYEGIKVLISHLIEDHNYTDIAFLTGKSWHPYSKERLKAYQDCMKEHNLEIKDNRMFFGDFWYTSGENLGDKLVKMNTPLPQAIACANDCMAVGLAKSLTEHGLRIPEDIAVVGYDSNDEGRSAPKPLTSVTLPARSLGTHASRYMMSLLNGLEPPVFDEAIDVYYGASCGCKNPEDTMVSRLRSTWSTELSSNGVFSPFNHMDEDLLSQSTFYGLLNTIFSYTYQIRDFAGFSICLNEDWQSFNSNEQSGKTYPFSTRMMHAIHCDSDSTNHDGIGVDEFFDRKQILPDLERERKSPRVFYFTPVYFENVTFGYAVISYDEPRAHTQEYRMWLRCVMRGLEYFRRQEQLRISNAKLEANLVRDPLTGFYNYKGLQGHSGAVLKELKGDKGSVIIGIIAVDIKNLSGINNEHGREAGDKSIIKVSNLLKSVIGSEYLYALGNGEFISIVSLEDGSDKPLQEYAEQIRKKLKEFSAGSGYEIDISAGYATGTPADNEELERLAGAAINNKNVRKRNFAKIENGDELTEEEKIQARIVHDILEHNKLNYHFQPIINAKTGDIFAYEALMRADVTPYMAPPVILRYAEYFNRLYDVEKATFNNVLDIFDSSESEFAEGSKVFINSIPGHVLRDDDFADITRKISSHSNRIVVEFTEQTEIREQEMAKIKKRYEDAGLQTAIDDYGTGYSNVANLLAYMPNYVKIDRMLLSEIQNSPQKQHFVKDIISFSHENGILALAEGIETAEEYKTILELGADLVQGYFVARPSGTIIKEIDPEIKKIITDLNAEVAKNLTKDTYVAGREGRISLPVLIEKGYTKIVIPNAEVAYRDITISGAPGLVSDICIVVEDGYSGSLELDNVGLSGEYGGNSIFIGEGCDVTIQFEGDNVLDNGGIRVPQTSRVIFGGDGYVRINVNKLEAYGIGNALQAMHGELVFDQEGTIEINIDSSLGIGIGSGLGGDIKIVRGRYFINMAGQSGVGIGSVSGSTEPLISNCEMHITNRAMRCVGVGSVEGDLDIALEKISFNCMLAGSEGVAIGSISGGKCNISVTNGYVSIKADVSELMCVGSLRSDDTSIKMNTMSIKCNYRGNKAMFMGSFGKKARFNIVSAASTVTAVSDMDKCYMANDEECVVINSKIDIDLNGESSTITRDK